MESVVTEGLISQLVEAIQNGEIAVIVGVALIILSGLLVLITRDRLGARATELISAGTSVASGIGLLLTSGRLWYEAILLGLFAAPASRGFWSLLGKLIPKAKAGPGSAAAVLVVFFALATTGCNGQRPPENACEIESTVVQSLSAGVEAAAQIVGDSAGEDWDIALDSSRFAVQVGEGAVRGCELARDGAEWQQWVTEVALPAAVRIYEFIDTMAGPEDMAVPPELVEARARLEAERDFLQSH